MTKRKPSVAHSSFEHSSVFRHLSFVLRHLPHLSIRRERLKLRRRFISIAWTRRFFTSLTNDGQVRRSTCSWRHSAIARFGGRYSSRSRSVRSFLEDSRRERLSYACF